VPAGQVGRLQASPAVSSVTENEPVAMQAAAYAPTTDVGSLYNTTLATGAQAYWKAGFTGKGVDVAVVDTGTVPVPVLATAGKLINGPDLSFESQAKSLRYLDTYGHGTHREVKQGKRSPSGTQAPEASPERNLTSVSAGQGVVGGRDRV
jgi:serine protease AprX